MTCIGLETSVLYEWMDGKVCCLAKILAPKKKSVTQEKKSFDDVVLERIDKEGASGGGRR